MSPKNTFVFEISNFHKEKDVMKALEAVDGVTGFNLKEGKVTVSAFEDSKAIKSKLERKTGKRVVLSASQNSPGPIDQDTIDVPKHDETNADIKHGSRPQTHGHEEKNAIVGNASTVSMACSSAPLSKPVAADNYSMIKVTNAIKEQSTEIFINTKQRTTITTGDMQVVISGQGPQETANAASPKTCDAGHDLVLEKEQPLYECSECKEFGFRERYKCRRCQCVLHPDCMNHKKAPAHELLKGCDLKFKKEPQQNRFCDACGMGISGISYGDEKKGKYLHPYCLNLTKKVTFFGENFWLSKELGFECWICNSNNKKDRKNKCWYYSSESKPGRHFHVYCMKTALRKSFGGDSTMVLKYPVKKVPGDLEWTQKFLPVFFSLLTIGVPIPLFSVELEESSEAVPDAEGRSMICSNPVKD